MKQGYERIAGPREDLRAVAWWYVEDLGDDVVFARGGRVRTSRLARRAIEHARAEARAERVALATRPTHRLDRKGNLVPL